MNLDIRIPIGSMFAIIGLLLTFYGIITAGDTILYVRSGGINVNLYWGIVLVIFGAVMFFAGKRAVAPSRSVGDSSESFETENREKESDATK